jgi:hypothetical protein
MRQKNFIVLLFCALILGAPAAYAQQDIGEALDPVIKDGELTAPDQNQLGRIDNIPVELVFNTDDKDLLIGSMLIVSAYAPAPPNIRRSVPLMLGQTHLLLTDMGSPLKVIIAAPSAITHDLDYVRIEAAITDTSGTVIYNLKEPGKYEGYEIPILNLSHIGKAMAEKPEIESIESVELISKIVRGKVKLRGSPPKFSGSNLVTRLVEDGLAGGNSSVVLGEVRQILDGKRAPFSFKFEGEATPSQNDMPLAIEVWIEDWAGRKTHVTPAPTPYTGPKTRYRIKLDAIGPQVYNPMPSKVAIRKAMSKTVPVKKVVAITKPKPKQKPNPKQKPKHNNVVVKKIPAKNKKNILAKAEVKSKPRFKQKLKPAPKLSPLPPFQKITGKAQFNANKGLPKGSVLIAELERKNNGRRPALLASTRIFLDGLSGDVSFKLKANTVDLNPALPPAKLRVRIEDKNGKLFFSNRGGTLVRADFNAVKLTTSPYY